jgi:hypothetical protein
VEFAGVMLLFFIFLVDIWGNMLHNSFRGKMIMTTTSNLVSINWAAVLRVSVVGSGVVIALTLGLGI